MLLYLKYKDLGTIRVNGDILAVMYCAKRRYEFTFTALGTMVKVLHKRQNYVLMSGKVSSNECSKVAEGMIMLQKSKNGSNGHSLIEMYLFILVLT